MPTKTTPTTQQWRLQSLKRSKGLYFQAVWGSGKDRRCVTLGYLTPEEAEAALQALRLEQGPGLAKLDEAGNPKISDWGVREWATSVSMEAVVDHHLAEQARASGDYGKMPLKMFLTEVYLPVRNAEVCAGTRRNDGIQWRKINPLIGSIPLKKVDGVAVEKVMAHYAANSPPTRRRMLLAIKGLLSYAESIGVIKEIPRMRPVKNGMSRVKGRPIALSASEVAAILAEATSATQRAMWAYAVGQGLRPTEAANLDWKDVDWSSGQILVRGTKTEKSLRKVPMTGPTRAELEPYWIAIGKPKEGWAFPNRFPDRPPPKKWSAPFKRAAKRAGVEKVVNSYSCRHTFATSCAMSGVPLPAAREMLGHTSHSRTLEEVYSNPDASMLAAAISGLTKLGG